MIARVTKLLALLPFVAFAACSSSDSGGGSSVGSIPAAFAKYCTGTLKTEQKIMHPMGAGAWIGSGEKIPAGSKFLLESEFGWGGYAMDGSGGPLKLSVSGTSGLVKDTDFTSDCAPATAPSFGDASLASVVLGKSTVYPNKDLTGTACTIDAGTQLSNYSYSSSGGSDPAEVSSAEIKSTCAIDKGYTKDFLSGYLLPLGAVK